MRGIVLIVAVTAWLLAGCAQAESPTEPPTEPSADRNTSGTPASGSGTAAPVPPSPEPAASGPCPYLETMWVARTNGQRVSKVRLSEGEVPTCFFYAPGGEQQLMVRVYTGEQDVATALVDNAAPVQRSNPAERPTGWKGGYMSTADGAVYAVAKARAAVVARTNQRQSVKAREVVERTIGALDL